MLLGVHATPHHTAARHSPSPASINSLQMAGLPAGGELQGAAATALLPCTALDTRRTSAYTEKHQVDQVPAPPQVVHCRALEQPAATHRVSYLLP